MVHKLTGHQHVHDGFLGALAGRHHWFGGRAGAQLRSLTLDQAARPGGQLHAATQPCVLRRLHVGERNAGRCGCSSVTPMHKPMHAEDVCGVLGFLACFRSVWPREGRGS